MKVYKAVETSESRDVETSEIEKGLSIPELEAQPSSYEIEERASGRETDGKYERDEDDDIDSEPILGVGEIPDKYITNEARIQLLRSSLKRSTPTKEDLRLDLLHKASKLFIAGEIEGTFQEYVYGALLSICGLLTDTIADILRWPCIMRRKMHSSDSAGGVAGK